MFSIEEVGCSEASSLDESEIFNISTGRELERRDRGLHDTFKKVSSNVKNNDIKE